MPSLNANTLPKSGVAVALERIRAKLDGAQGLSGKLNQSVKRGLDAMLHDAMEQRILETQMPCLRIEADTSQYEFVSNAANAVNSTIPISIFFFYYVQGYTQPTVLPSDFVDLRERHIRWNIEHLKNKHVLPNNSIGFEPSDYADSSGKIFWWWPNGEQTAAVTHNANYEVNGIVVPIPLPTNFTCSRLDFSIVVSNHCTFS